MGRLAEIGIRLQRVLELGERLLGELAGAGPRSERRSSAASPSAGTRDRGPGRLVPIDEPAALRPRRPDRRRALAGPAARQHRAVPARAAVEPRAALRRARHRASRRRCAGCSARFGVARAAHRRGAQAGPAPAARRARRAARRAVALPALLRRSLLRRGREPAIASSRPRSRAASLAPPANVRIIATSNRRHLLPETRRRQPRGAPRRGRRSAHGRGGRREARALRPLRPRARLLRLRPGHLSRDRRALRDTGGDRAARASSCTRRRCAGRSTARAARGARARHFVDDLAGRERLARAAAGAHDQSLPTEGEWRARPSDSRCWACSPSPL